MSTQSSLFPTTSLDGAKITVVSTNGDILTSIDSGLNWTTKSFPGISWNSVTSSANGKKLAATSNIAQIYTLGHITDLYGGENDSTTLLCISNMPSAKYKVLNIAGSDITALEAQ